MSHAIMGQGLEKSFAKRRSIGELLRDPFGRGEPVEALRGVDLAVPQGGILGLLGPNGAGKTTLLKILSCLVLPDAGHAEIDGIPTDDENRVKKRIGLVHSDERSFYWRLSGVENLRFFATLYDVPHREVESRIERLFADLDLTEAAERRFSDYSSGMKQRMAIARAMLHDPPILLMDEPSRSLDPASSLVLRELIAERLHRQNGKTILLASHDLTEVQALCDRLIVLIEGRVRLEGTVDDVRRFGIDAIELVVESTGGTPPEGNYRILKDETVEGVRTMRLALESESAIPGLVQSFVNAGCSVRRFDRVEPDLESAFRRILDAHRSKK